MDILKDILEIILKYTDDGIHVVDSSGRTIIYNNAMEELEGLKKEEILGKNILEVFPGLTENTSTLYNVMKSNKPIENSFQTYINKKGYTITSVNTSIPILKNGELYGAVEVSKNFTRVKELYDNLSKLNEKKEEKNIPDPNFSTVIGCSQRFLKAVQLARKAADSFSTVLIYGETGTGKEVFAKAIHNEGKRSDKPFIAVNCAAIPEALLESILFGTVKGSFTGAIDRPGLFEQAHRGTLLLDEINSMSLGLQAKLLRVLQEGTIRRIGDVKDITVDVRIIATANEEPSEAILKGALRKDLYYRLSVISITIPTLKERKEDIPLLIKHFIGEYNRVFSKNIWDVSRDVMDAFLSYDWQGNVRELKNYIEGAMNMASGHILNKGHFTPMVQDILFHDAKIEEMLIDVYKNNKPLNEYISEIEKKILIDTLKNSEGNISKAARKLGLKRQTLQHKLKKYNIIEE